MIERPPGPVAAAPSHEIDIERDSDLCADKVWKNRVRQHAGDEEAQHADHNPGAKRPISITTQAVPTSST